MDSDNVGSADVPIIPIENILVRHVLVRDINTSEIIQEVYPNGILPDISELPDFNSNIDNDPNWYRLKEANDGDCLYWCILQVLEDNNLHPEITNIGELRMFLIHVLQTEPERVYPDYDVNTLDFIVEEKIHQLEIGIIDPSNYDGWGREEDIPIISWAFNLNIYIYYKANETWLTSYNNNHNNLETINVFLEFTGSHYNILLPKSDKFNVIEPFDDDYFAIVENIELIPEIKKFVQISHIQSVKAAWNFFKKYNFRNHIDANDAFNIRPVVSAEEFNIMYSFNTPYTPRNPRVLPSSPQTARPSKTNKSFSFQSDDRVSSYGGNFRKRTSKKRKLQQRVASRKNKTHSKHKYLKFRKMKGGGEYDGSIRNLLTKSERPDLLAYFNGLNVTSPDNSSVNRFYERHFDNPKVFINLVNTQMLSTPTFQAPPPPYPVHYIVNLDNTINYPKDENGKYINFEQTVGRMGTGPNRVAILANISSTNYFVIISMESASPDSHPRVLYEKIGDPNIVKSVGRFTGLFHDIKKLILD
jgi:hypothetical protein